MVRKFKIEGVKTSRDVRGGFKPSKFAAPNEKNAMPGSIKCPGRMELFFKSDPLDRWLCLTPKEWNEHHGYYMAIPVTIERSKDDPFEYHFVYDRQSMIGLCHQIHSLPIDSPYMSLGFLTRIDHEQISRLIIKIIGEPSLSSKI